MPYTGDVTEVKCPRCGGRMWDNRATKKNPKAPDYKCRDNQCLDPKSGMVTAIWEKDLERGGSRLPQPTVKPVATSGKAPYSVGGPLPYETESETGAPPAPNKVSVAKLDSLLNLYHTIEDNVLAVSAKKFAAAGVGASPESIAAQIATLFIAAKDRGLAI